MSAHFGLDIGSCSIKAIQIEEKGKKYKLLALGEEKTPVNFNSSAENDKRMLAGAIRKIVTEAGMKTKEVVLSLPETAVFSQVIELPRLSPTELKAAINFEAEQHIPIPLNEVKLEYLVLSPSLKGTSEEKMEVLLMAAKESVINQMVSLMELAGLIPLALETDILSLIRVANSSFQGNCLFLNLGGNATNIFILQDQTLKFIRTLDTAGEAFTRAVAQELNMAPLQAEQYKIAYGLNKAALGGKVRQAILPLFNVILTEMKKALNFFFQKHGQAQIKKLIISGGGALLPELKTELAALLNLEAMILDPFVNFIEEEKWAKIKGRPKFATTIGLAMREE
jgi:type IV pilus assembly protein PilM